MRRVRRSAAGGRRPNFRSSLSAAGDCGFPPRVAPSKCDLQIPHGDALAHGVTTWLWIWSERSVNNCLERALMFGLILCAARPAGAQTRDALARPSVRLAPASG